MWRPCTSNTQCVYESEITPQSVAILTVINFAIKFIPWNFLKRKLESEASRCSFASSSSSSFMPVGSNNRKPLWS